jgi:hypothetical protein
VSSVRDVVVARRANSHGARYSLRIILEARRAGIPISLGFALVETESGFRNVWGHDAEPNGGTTHLGGKPVRKADYLAYKKRRGPTGRGGMQGVGVSQLTWYSTQDRADSLGGCWIAKHNIAVAFDILASNIKQHGERAGIKAYNGSGLAAERYASLVLGRKVKWHRRLA